MRQISFYRTVPEKSTKSRYEQYQSRGGIEFPTINGGAYLLQFLDEIGYCRSGMNGAIPLDYTEINAYIQSTNTPLLPFEVLLLKKLSNAYVSQSYDKDPLSFPPYATYEIKEISSDKKILNAFSGFCKVVESK